MFLDELLRVHLLAGYEVPLHAACRHVEHVPHLVIAHMGEQSQQVEA